MSGLSADLLFKSVKRHESRLTLLTIERSGHSMIITALDPEGNVGRNLYGFWENEDGHPYVVTGTRENTLSDSAGFGQLDLYLRDEHGNCYLQAYWSDHLEDFKEPLNLTRTVEGTATGIRRSDDLITLEYTNLEGEPDTFTFARASVVTDWAFWMSKSPSAIRRPQPRYLFLPVASFWHVDLAVPDDDLYGEIDRLMEMRLRSGWMLRRDEHPKHDAGRQARGAQP